MELRDVEVFLVLAEELHFRRTAERLYLSTGRVSQTVRALELEVGAPLFARNSRSVRLTTLGQQFRKEATRGLEELKRALRRAQATARGLDGVLRVGYLPCVASPYVARLVSAFETHYPSTRVVMKVLHASAGFAMLDDGKIDLLFAWSPGGNPDAVAGEDRAVGPILGTDERAVLVSSDHPLASHENVSVEEIARYELVDFHLDTPPSPANTWTPAHTPAGKKLRRATELETLTDAEHRPSTLLDLMSVVAREQYAHLTVRSLLTYQPYPGLALVPVTDLPPCVMVPIWSAKLETAAIRAFIDTAARTTNRSKPIPKPHPVNPPRITTSATTIEPTAS